MRKRKLLLIIMLTLGFISWSKTDSITMIEGERIESRESSCDPGPNTIPVTNNTDFSNLIPNTTYVFSGVFTIDVNVENITLPEGVVLFFEDGGLLNDNGRLIGNQTKIINCTSDNGEIFNDVGFMDGTWDVDMVYPSWFGAIENGLSLDTDALQKAVSVGGNIGLGYAYKIDDTITITKETSITTTLGNQGHSLITYETPSSNNYAFTFLGNENIGVEISGIQINTNGLLRIGTDANLISLHRNKVINTTSRETQHAIVNSDFDGNNAINLISRLEIFDNDFERVSVAFLHRMKAEKLIFDANRIDNCYRYVVRAESLSSEEQLEQGYISFQKNVINGLSGIVLPPGDDGEENISGRIARVLQASASTTIDYKDNIIRDVSGCRAANYIYWSRGNLNFIDNVCVRISSGTGAIHDKGLLEEYSVLIQGNTFDQTGEGLLESCIGNTILRNPKLGIINIHRADNVVIDSNKYINLRTFALRISHPLNGDAIATQPSLPENISFTNNTVSNTDNKSVILVSPAVTGLDILNNCINGLSNSIIETNHHPRFIEFSINSTVQLAVVNDVLIDGNTVTNIHNNSEMLWVNDGTFDCPLDVNLPAKINNVIISNNGQEGGQSFVTFQGATGIRNLSIVNNIHHDVIDDDLIRGTNSCIFISPINHGNVEVDEGVINCAIPIANANNSKSNDIIGSKIQIYPNPFDEFVNIESKESLKSLTIRRFDGVLIKSLKITDTKQFAIQYAIEDVPKGVYFIIIETASDTYTRQIVKK